MSIDMVDKNRVSTYKYRIKKIENKIIKILAKSKTWNLLKFSL